MVCNDVPHRRREMEREREDPTALKFHTATATTNNVDEAINFAVCLARPPAPPPARRTSGTEAVRWAVGTENQWESGGKF